MDESIRKKISGYAADEYFDYVIYSALAKKEKDEQRRAALYQLGEKEKDHYLFFTKLTGGDPGALPAVSALSRFGLILLRSLFGLVFTMKFLERHEHKVIEEYKSIASQLDKGSQDEFNRIINDEEDHENYFISQVNEPVIKYIGFIALGLTDAIIEVTGVHAGFLGALSSTLIAGVAGLIVGFSASISMGVAAYLKAKSESNLNPLSSAFVTSASYLFSVILLALPYFLTGNMMIAFFVSILLAIALNGIFTFYVAIIQERNFRREMIENILLLSGTAVATFLFGEGLNKLFNLDF
ncbi:MAG: rubrerythrin family protein [Bacteroidetes bacterium]|nr:rubrerythrin family protein [Bacteroidota bacterium]